MSTVRFRRINRGSRGVALLALALLGTPAAAFAQDPEPAEVPGVAARFEPGAQVPLGMPRTEIRLRAGARGGWLDRHAGSELPVSASDEARPLGSLPAERVLQHTHMMAAMTPSLPRHLLVGSGVGAAVGAAFALAVVSLADCGGPTCTQERVIAVASHALAGAAVGAIVGGVTYLIRR